MGTEESMEWDVSHQKVIPLPDRRTGLSRMIRIPAQMVGSCLIQLLPLFLLIPLILDQYQGLNLV